MVEYVISFKCSMVWYIHGRIGSPILVGFFFEGAPKKKRNCCQNEIADLKKKKKGY
jgi:hypothetical protein